LNRRRHRHLGWKARGELVAEETHQDEAGKRQRPATTGSIRRANPANPMPLHSPISMFWELPTIVIRRRPNLKGSQRGQQHRREDQADRVIHEERRQHAASKHHGHEQPSRGGRTRNEPFGGPLEKAAQLEMAHQQHDAKQEQSTSRSMAR
jgi:hypothetical protein